ncbi:MAG: hypothetical protein ACLQPH_02720 [Acidimicrobiales bacterium]
MAIPPFTVETGVQPGCSVVVVVLGATVVEGTGATVLAVPPRLDPFDAAVPEEQAVDIKATAMTSADHALGRTAGTHPIGASKSRTDRISESCPLIYVDRSGSSGHGTE